MSDLPHHQDREDEGRYIPPQPGLAAAARQSRGIGAQLGLGGGHSPPLQESSDQASRLIAQLKKKQDNLENRMRRNNLLFIGLPEGTEDNSPATYLEELLIATYGREALSQSFVVERAHWMPAKKPPQRAPLMVFIAKFLNKMPAAHSGLAA